MIDEVRGLLDQYAQWVRDKSILREVNDQYVEITTPYLDRHNDYTQIYVRKDDGGFVLTDGGDTNPGPAGVRLRPRNVEAQGAARRGAERFWRAA